MNDHWYVPKNQFDDILDRTIARLRQQRAVDRRIAADIKDVIEASKASHDLDLVVCETSDAETIGVALDDALLCEFTVANGRVTMLGRDRQALTIIEPSEVLEMVAGLIGKAHLEKAA